jgi:hypothetical protein
MIKRRLGVGNEEKCTTYLQEFGFHVLASHQVGQLQVKIDSDTSSGHLDGTARCRTLEGDVLRYLDLV